MSDRRTVRTAEEIAGNLELIDNALEYIPDLPESLSDLSNQHLILTRRMVLTGMHPTTAGQNAIKLMLLGAKLPDDNSPDK